MPSKSTAAALKDLFDALEVFRAQRGDPSLNLLTVFLVIAQRKTTSAAAISAVTGISQSSVSRNIMALGRGRTGDDGLGLVAQELDLTNTRAHAIRLTDKGRVLAEQLASCGRFSGPGEAERSSEGGKSSDVQARDAFQHVHWQNWVG